MRVEILSGPTAVSPGAACDVELEVFNTGDVIDTVTAQVVGDFPLTIEQRPAAVSLFPGTSQRVVVSMKLARDYPAGDHVVPIELRSAVAPEESSAGLDLEFAVPPVVDGSMDLVPSEITCGRTGKFKAQLVNKSNIPVDLSLTGTDIERGLAFSFDPPFVHLEPGEESYVVARAKGKRPFFGVVYVRPFTVNADGSGLTLQASGRTNHKPRIPRGALTILVLLLIIGLWAVIFTVGAGFVLGRDKLTKTVPAAFLVGQQNFSTEAVAGTMSGSVVSTSDGKPVSRMTVEAYLIRTGRQQLEQSAASGTDGAWTLSTLAPGNYHLRFTAPGFQELWYPNATDAAQAGVVVVRPLADTPKLDVKVSGNLGIISGNVAAGEQTSILATITVRPVNDKVVGEVVATTTSQPDGAFAVAGLQTPATYQLTVALPGFTDQVVTTTLGGGEDQVINTVQMAAGDGVLGGTVSSNGSPLGGVVVTVTGGGKTYTATTPTSGPVGVWTLAGLPTPATYIVTFALAGYGTETMALDLGAGQNRSDVNVALTSGTGTISGVVKDGAGNGLGDVNVTVTGSATPIATKTLTTGNVGGYTLNGLATPGRYTVTFALDGYAPVTRLVVLDDSGVATGVNVTLSKATGAIVGTISSGSTKLSGAAITLSDGKTQKATTSADSPAGGYRFDGLAPGSYTMTVTLSGYKTKVVIVTVTAGQDVTTDVSLTAVTS